MEMIRSIPRPLVTESQRPLVQELQNSSAQGLTAGRLRELLHYDPSTGAFTRRISTAPNARAGDLAGYPDGAGYTQIRLDNKQYRSHRLAWLYMYGEWPEEQIDHINRNRLDNRICNLRDVTNKQNMQNAGKYSNNASGHTGVYWNKRDSKWQAKIKHNRKNISLGYFDKLEDAVAARKAAEKLYWSDTHTQIAEPSPM